MSLTLLAYGAPTTSQCFYSIDSAFHPKKLYGLAMALGILVLKGVPVPKASGSRQKIQWSPRSSERIPFIDLAAQQTAVEASLGGSLLRQPTNSDFAISNFEQSFARFLGCYQTITLGSANSALTLILQSLNISDGDEVIIPAFADYQVAHSVEAAGAKLVLVDVDPNSGLIDVTAVRAALTANTRAVLAFHLYGQCADLDQLRQICEKSGLLLIEDATQATGAHYHGNRLGTLGDVSYFSFSPGRNLCSHGAGGAIATSNNSLADKIRKLRDQANYRQLDSLQARVLESKLDKIDDWNLRRRNIARQYTAALSHSFEATLPTEQENCIQAHQFYVIQHDHRTKLLAHLRAVGIDGGLHYPQALHQRPTFPALANQGSFPGAESLAERCLSLPLYPELNAQQIGRVIAELLQAETLLFNPKIKSEKPKENQP